MSQGTHMCPAFTGDGSYSVSDWLVIYGWWTGLREHSEIHPPFLSSFFISVWFSLFPISTVSCLPLFISLPPCPSPSLSLHLLQASCFLQPCKFWILTTPRHSSLLIQFLFIPVGLEHLSKSEQFLELVQDLLILPSLFQMWYSQNTL